MAANSGLPYRKKLLNPKTDIFGYGAVPTNDSTIIECFYADGTRRDIKDIEIAQTYSFPSEGYFPTSLLPKYWNYTTLDNHTSFKKAILRVSNSQGKAIPVEIIHRDEKGEQRSLVWKLKNPDLTNYIDKVLTVKISRILVAGTPSQVIYSIIPFATEGQ